MTGQIIGLQQWFQTPAGRYLLDWERSHIDEAVADIFGYHALQLGVPELDGLRCNRMPHRWLASEQMAPDWNTGAKPLDLLTHFAALPFPANSLDLVLLPHTLEFSDDPHETLHEVERVLVPEGRVVICGLSPVSLWGLRQRRGHLYRRLGLDSMFLPDEGAFIAYRRLRDWLRLLGFEVEIGRHGCYRPAVSSEKWLLRTEWMERAGARWWPFFGAAYFIVAVKRVRGVRLMGAAWRRTPARAGKPVTLAGRTQQQQWKE